MKRVLNAVELLFRDWPAQPHTCDSIRSGYSILFNWLGKYLGRIKAARLPKIGR